MFSYTTVNKGAKVAFANADRSTVQVDTEDKNGVLALGWFTDADEAAGTVELTYTTTESKVYFNILLEGCTDNGDGFNETSTDITEASSYVLSFLETETHFVFYVNEVMLKNYTLKDEATCKTVWNKVATKLSVLDDGGDTEDDTAAARKIRAPSLAETLGLLG